MNDHDEPQAAARAAEIAAVRANIARVRNRIADAGGDPNRVRILAVTKGFDAEVARMAVAAGLADLGENYAQELRDKAPEVTGARWHFIGRLQTNKVRTIAEVTTCWQTVDRPRLVDELAKRCPSAEVMIQVNATGESHKGGAAPAAVGDLVGRAVDAGLTVTGLMAVGRSGDPAATSAAFAAVADLADHLALPERSLGMSDDLALAVAAGSTMVRVGRALFGPRPPAGGGPADPRSSPPAVRD